MLKLTDDRRKVGGVALGAVWIGNSEAEQCGPLEMADIGAVLNVAQDLVSRRVWPVVESMHVGLIDGPGNEPAVYCAAVYALHALLKRHNTLVCCHSGGRSLAVALTYLVVTSDRSWDQWLEALYERVDYELPTVKQLHRDAFNQVVGILKGNV